MAQNITLLGASYTDVPSVRLPKTGGGTALFDDTTDATATADKILEGYTAWANGVKIIGTASGGGPAGHVWQDQDGYVHLSNEDGSGLECETGTWTPSEDINTSVNIQFTNAHTIPPVFYAICDTGEFSDALNSNYSTAFFDLYQAFGAPMSQSSTSSVYGWYRFGYKGSSSGTAITYSAGQITSASQMSNYATNEHIVAYTNSSSRYWRAGRNYKWMAVWAPTT